jgi:FkbM family methyltransferase
MIQRNFWFGMLFVVTAPCHALSSLSDPSRRSVAIQSTATVERIPFLASSLSESTRSSLSTWKEALQENPKLFHGCTKIFLDVGSNRGTHVRKLFEPHKYPRSPYVKLFEKYFGHWIDRRQPFSKTGICAFGFEANPTWASTLKDVENEFAKQNWRVKFFSPVAVSNTTGNVDFWVRHSNMTKHSNWGASIIPFSQRMHEFLHKDEFTVSVPKIDLSSFVDEMRKKAPPGFRLMKMDIEGSEFVVLPPFLKKQLLCKSVLDMLTIEWHEHILEKAEDRERAAEVHGQIEDPGACDSGPPTDIETLDDESYYNDGAKFDVEA